MLEAKKITSRVDLNLGSACNARCRFCYYQKTTSKGYAMHDVAAKKWIRYFFSKGKRAIEFTGGEPTIRDDIAKLVNYAADIGYNDIAIITNAISLSDKKMMELKASGLTEFLFSVHGAEAKTHDYLTDVNGSFDKIVSAMKNAKALGIFSRANVVVNGVNFRQLKEIASLLLDCSIKRVNFILFNPVVDAGGSQKDIWLDYRVASTYLKDVIDNYEMRFDAITVRYIPFCFMQGYEKYVINLKQVQYDPYEWDYYLRSVCLRGNLLAWLAVMWGCALSFFGYILGRGYIFSKNVFLMETIIFLRKRFYNACRRCRYRKNCDGIWKEYVRCFSASDFPPVG
jgi:MoaA/NifB/PqqE/SkfB family radical SAM enzyme